MCGVIAVAELMVAAVALSFREIHFVCTTVKYVTDATMYVEATPTISPIAYVAAVCSDKFYAMIQLTLGTPFLTEFYSIITDANFQL